MCEQFANTRRPGETMGDLAQRPRVRPRGRIPVGNVTRGRTAVGRTTVAVLAMNDPEAVKVREMLLKEGRIRLAD